MRLIEHQLPNVTEEREYRAAFDFWLNNGDAAVSARPQMERMLSEHRATIGLQGTPGGGAFPGSTAGQIVPIEYAHAIVEATKYAGPMMQLATVDITDTGRIRAYPTINDTAETGSLVAEGGAVSINDITAGLTNLEGFKINTVLKVSWEADQDIRVAPNVPGFLNRVFGVRIGRYLNQKAAIGAGTTEPTGFLTAGTNAGGITGANGNDGASNSHNSLGSVDFATLQAAIDFSYWEAAVWMVAPVTLATLCGQLDKQGRFLFPGLQNDVQTVNGKRIYAHPSLGPLPAAGPNSPTVTTNVLALLDPSKVVIKMSRPVLLRLDQTYGANGITAFMLYTVVDSNIIDGNSGASCQYLTATY
jgi:HK97 family phage major capsid protein